METKDLLLTDRDKIRKEWGKTASDVKEFVTILKEWMKTQTHLPEIPNDNLIEYFLTNCKYSIEKTKENLDMYYTIHQVVPELFIHPLKCNLAELASKTSYIVTLPKLDDNLCRITIIKYHKEIEDIFEPLKLAAYVCDTFEIRLHEDLVMGETLIYDAEHLSMGHVVKLTPSVFKKIALMLQAVLRNRLKGIHLINCPPYIDKLISLAKMFMKKKIYERIHLHPNMESLYKTIPQKMLPSDYGGDELSMKTIMDLWKVKFKQYEKRFDFLEQMEVNENLRPEPLMNSEVLGYYGNFKKIDVD